MLARRVTSDNNASVEKRGNDLNGRDCPALAVLLVGRRRGARAFVGFAVFSQLPSSDQIQNFLDRAIRMNGQTPQYVVTDKGVQFWCRGFKRWCTRRGIRPRYGAVGEPASIAIVERFIRSLKQECIRPLLVPLSLTAMRREVGLFAS